MQKSLMSFIICVLAYVRTLMAILFQFRLFFFNHPPLFFEKQLSLLSQKKKKKPRVNDISILFFSFLFVWARDDLTGAEIRDE